MVAERTISLLALTLAQMSVFAATNDADNQDFSGSTESHGRCGLRRFPGEDPPPRELQEWFDHADGRFAVKNLDYLMRDGDNIPPPIGKYKAKTVIAEAHGLSEAQKGSLAIRNALRSSRSTPTTTCNGTSTSSASARRSAPR